MINFGKVVQAEVTEIVSILDRVRDTSSTIAKQAILKGNKDNEGLQTILELTYNPFKKYKVTEKTLGECEGGVSFKDLRMATQILAKENINDELRRRVNNFLAETDIEIRDLYKGVLLKDLKLGVNASTINKIWKDLIPTSDDGTVIKPMLASKFDFDKPPTGEFAVTEKLDGIRCIAICKEGNIQLFSRQGKLIKGCLDIENDLLAMYSCIGKNFVVDGELLARDCTYENIYKETTKRVKNKDEVKKDIVYKIFDMLDMEEFNTHNSNTPYYKRMGELVYSFNLCRKVVKNIEVINSLYIGKDINRVLELLDEYRLKGAEGLMLNLMDSMYEFKRSKSIFKVKVMQTCDLKIIGFEEGQGRNKGRLGALLVEYKGFKCGVGSGFSDTERVEIWNNQDDFLGRICEIQYFEESKNKDGEVSLRFPVWKHLRLDKTEPSYN